MYLDNLNTEFENRFKNRLLHKENELDNMFKLFEQNSIESKFSFINEQIVLLKQNYKSYLNQLLNAKENRLGILKEAFENKNPKKNDINGYAQISLNNKIINIEDLKVDDKIRLQSPKIIAYCTVNNIEQQ